VEVADVLGAGVAKALLGKDVLADDVPFVTGAIGLLGTRPSWDLMMGCPGGSCGSCRLACPTERSSPPTPGRPPTGTPAT
jgi:hypothetical protein